MDEVAESEFDMQAGIDSLGADLFGAEDLDTGDDLEEDIENKEEPETPEETEPEEPSEPEEPKRSAPKSWKKEMHEKWGTLPEDVQEYIEQREEEMKNGLSINKDDSSLGKSVRDIMNPYKEILDKANVDPTHMIKSLMAAHYKLTTADQGEKAQIMAKLAHSYGVNLADEQVMNYSKNINPQVEQLQNRINQLEYSLSERESAARQAEQDEITNKVNEFADSHEYFDEVSDQVVAFIQAGETLEDAYEKAIWANPITRQKEIDRIEQEKIDAANKAKMEKVRAAKKAKSVNVESRETSKSPTGFLGSMEDTMHDVLRDIQNRT